MRIFIVSAAFLAVLGAAAHSADGDAEAGAKVFRRCQACHTADGAQNRVGPYLAGVFGRPIASLEDFSYSDALREKGADGAVWDEASLSSYLMAPKEFAPGNKMAFAGLKKPEDIANIIAYLASLPAP